MHNYYSFIIFFFILAGLAAAIWNGRKIIQNNKKRNWPYTKAAIFYKANDKPETSAPDIYFRYSVSDKHFEQKITPTPSEETIPGFAEHFKKQYPADSEINVYYEPGSPETTLFKVGATTEDKLIFGISIGAILLGLYAITI
ncbi:MAG: DUF3592 domain-containing protein [Gammaproteobacteria bacterium]|nr:DUF3592 domain-containing protein [Gammaproteobacteria bacterium]